MLFQGKHDMAGTKEVFTNRAGSTGCVRFEKSTPLLNIQAWLKSRNLKLAALSAQTCCRLPETMRPTAGRAVVFASLNAENGARAVLRTANGRFVAEEVLSDRALCFKIYCFVVEPAE